MTMPKGFSSGKEYNYCTNCRHTEQYHRRVTPIRKGTMPKGMESMIKTHNTACGLCNCDKFVDKEMQQINYHYSSQSPQYNNSSRRSKGEIADKAAAGLLIGSLIAGFTITVIGIIVLHFGAIIFGMVLFFLPLVIAYVVGGGGNARNNDHYYDAFFMNRWGSYQAKKNMRRGHRWNK